MTDIVELSREAASHWGQPTVAPKLVSDRENAVFDMTLPGDGRVALRLHRQGYQSTAFIESELRWTEQLERDHDIPCPAPVRTKAGGLTVTLSTGRVASTVRWIDAKPIGANGVAFAGPLDQQTLLYTRLGRLIRKLHTATDQLAPGGVVRPSWDATALLGEVPHWGRFWENPSLTEVEQTFLQSARAAAMRQLTEGTTFDMGLIHADLLQENILQNAAGLHIIDFDDGGFGYRLFDLGTALIQHAEHVELDALSNALCAGYGCDAKHMPLFIMLRSFASCGWIMSRALASDPRQRFYADRALICAQRYMTS